MPSERALKTHNVRFFGLMGGKIEVLTLSQTDSWGDDRSGLGTVFVSASFRRRWRREHFPARGTAELLQFIPHGRQQGIAGDPNLYPGRQRVQRSAATGRARLPRRQGLMSAHDSLGPGVDRRPLATMTPPTDHRLRSQRPRGVRSRRWEGHPLGADVRRAAARATWRPASSGW